MKKEIETQHLSALSAVAYAMQDEENAKKFSEWVSNMFTTITKHVNCDSYIDCENCPSMSQCDIFYYLGIGIDYIKNGGDVRQAFTCLRGDNND